MSTPPEEGRAVVDGSLPAPELLRQIVEMAQGGGFGEGIVEVPVPALAAVLAQRDKLLEAVGYVLTRAQVDPDLGYYLGPLTEAWERLVTGEALAIGVDRGERRRERMRDLQPPHRQRLADVIELGQRAQELEEQLAAERRGAEG